jgi:putative phage cell wall peptidase, NlpC/P60 family
MKRSEIVKEAEGWAGTKWQHQQARKQVACDCAGLARGVYANLTGTKVEVMDYPATWHLFKKEERLYNTCKEIMTEKKLEDIKAGDILLFSYRPSFVCHHIGIYLGREKFIHSDMDVGKVIVSNLDNFWKKRLRTAFEFKEVED